MEEVLIGAVAEAILSVLIAKFAERNIVSKQLDRLKGDSPEKLALKASLSTAFNNFAREYPELANSLLDAQYLIKPEVATEMAKLLTPNRSPYKPTLEALWYKQFSTPPAVDLSEPLAYLIDNMEAEITANPVLMPFVATRSLHRIEHNTEGLVRLVTEFSDIFRLYSLAPQDMAANIRIKEFENLVRERTRLFVGREYIVQAILGLIDDPAFTSGYIIVSGEPGIGKTALLAHLVEQWGSVHHFNVAAQNIRTPDQFLRNICAQLIVRYRLPHSVLPADASKDSGYLSRLLVEASAQLGAKPLLVLVDALDEAEEVGWSSRTNRLFLPPSLPVGVYVIVTTRPQHDPALVVDQQRDIYLGDDDPRNLEDVRTYISNYLQAHRLEISQQLAPGDIDESELIQILTEKSEGNFMYLTYVLNDIRAGKYGLLHANAVLNLPKGLRGYYKAHWRLMCGRYPAQFDKSIRPVICLLATVRESVSVSQLAHWSGLPHYQVREVIAGWREFLNEDETAGEQRFRIYHTSFRDFLQEEVGLDDYHDLIVNAALLKIFPPDKP
ncbi:MAG: AAA family ATPase [Chloroflexota bacterium]